MARESMDIGAILARQKIEKGWEPKNSETAPIKEQEEMAPQRETNEEGREVDAVGELDIAFFCAIEDEAEGFRNALRITQGNPALRLNDNDVSRPLFRYFKYCGLEAGLFTQSQVGIAEAATLTTRCILSFNPRLVVMVGICAGREDKEELGDIAIADSALDMVSGRLNADDTFYERPRSINANRTVLDRLRHHDNENAMFQINQDWPEHDGRIPRVHFGTFACSPAVVDNKRITDYLTVMHNNFVAIEMESFGFSLAAETLGTKWLVVKGIQDFADGDKGEAERGIRRKAAYHSAAYALAVAPQLIEGTR